MNLLFICSRNRLRSPTAEVIFAEYPEIQAMSAGTAPDAEVVVSADLVEWADIIFVTEQAHSKRLKRQFSHFLKGKRLVVLDIRDEYDYMDPELVRMLRTRVSQHLR
jgi:predicted protein tyrosine phosphatase